MFKLLFIISSLFISLVSHASNFETFNGTYLVEKYTWCNGPISDDKPGACSIFGWNGVDLDQIDSFKFEYNKKGQVIKLTDLEGNTWEKDLKNCNDKPHKIQGCRHSLKYDDKERHIKPYYHAMVL